MCGRGARLYSVLLPALFGVACAHPGASGASPVGDPTGHHSAASDTVFVKDPQLEQRVARLELRLLERDAQLEELQARLDEARREVVRAMAKLQTLASRAEAASGMAEAEIALQALRTAAAQPAAADVAQAAQLLQLSTAEFNKQNYGGALYLANQAKSVVATGRERVGSGVRGPLRSGEVLFALPLRLEATSRSNVREGPGAGYRVLFTLDAGAPITAYSFAEQWVRITDETGRSGWVSQTLIGRPRETAR
jgi:uncharacterized coiled-coil protein SlyX